MATIRWSVDARRDLRAAFDYIARDSVAYASATVNQIITSVDRLRLHPQLGRMVPEYQRPEIREIIVMSYRVVYQVRGSKIGIAAVVHGSRDLAVHVNLSLR